MVDYVRITVKAGNGGDGQISFKVQKGKPFGVADGGDGGRGGNAYIVPTEDLNTLAPFRFKKILRPLKEAMEVKIIALVKPVKTSSSRFPMVLW